LAGTPVYPILGMCLDFVDSTPFPIAVFCGSGKPEPIDMFLESFITEVKVLKREGIHYKNQFFNFDIAFFICDAPARCYLKKIVGHTAKHACEKCHIIGVHENQSEFFTRKF
jgi:hypothetical protein